MEQRFETWNVTAPGFLNTLTNLTTGAGLWLFLTEPASWTQSRLPGPNPIDLVQGFNLIMWMGADETDAVRALADIEGAVEAAFARDARTGATLTYRPAGPSFLNDLESLDYGEGFWLLFVGATRWVQPLTLEGDCHPSYPGVCIPPPPPDLDCGDVPFRRFQVVGEDPHGFDSDNDGVGCESG